MPSRLRDNQFSLLNTPVGYSRDTVVPSPPLPDSVCNVSIKVIPGKDAEPSWLWKGRIPCLDGLRALSIFLVLFEHLHKSRGFPEIRGQEWLLGKVGGVGVDVFFALSGFLITLLLLRERERTGAISLKRFYLRRCLRLLPAFLLFALTVFGLTLIGAVAVRESDWLHIFTYTVNFAERPTWEIGHLWSLSIEEQFYLFWPIALMLLGKQRAKYAILAWLMTAPFLRAALLITFPTTVGRFDLWTPMHVDTIAIGCLLAICATDSRFRARFATSARTGVSLIVALVVFVLVHLAIRNEIAAYDVILGPSIDALCIAALIWLCVSHSKTLIGQFLELRFMVALGLVSYSVYLWQQLFLKPAGAGWAVSWPINLLLVFTVAAVSYYLIERPFLALKDRLEHDSGASSSARLPESAQGRKVEGRE